MSSMNINVCAQSVSLNLWQIATATQKRKSATRWSLTWPSRLGKNWRIDTWKSFVMLLMLAPEKRCFKSYVRMSWTNSRPRLAQKCWRIESQVVRCSSCVIVSKCLVWTQGVIRGRERRLLTRFSMPRTWVQNIKTFLWTSTFYHHLFILFLIVFRTAAYHSFTSLQIVAGVLKQKVASIWRAILLITSKIGCAGLYGLECAYELIQWEPWWIATAETQAYSRSLRPEQDTVINVYYVHEENLMTDRLTERIRDGKHLTNEKTMGSLRRKDDKAPKIPRIYERYWYGWSRHMIPFDVPDDHPAAKLRRTK